MARDSFFNMHDGRLLEAAIIGGQFDGDVVLIPRMYRMLP